MTKTIHFDQLESEATKLIREFIKEEEEKVREIIPEVAKPTRRLVRELSPGDGQYASGWRIKYDREAHMTGFVVHMTRKNAPLTHLLEKGHAVKNQYGSYPKRTRAFPHVAPAQEFANDLVMKKLRKEL